MITDVAFAKAAIVWFGLMLLGMAGAKNNPPLGALGAAIVAAAVSFG